MRALFYFIGDLPYLLILWVVYGIFLPASDVVLMGLLIRYLLIWTLGRTHLLVFGVSVFVASTVVYILPFFVSNAPVLVGIRDGSIGDFSAHWGMAAIAGILAAVCFLIVRLLIERLAQPRLP